MIFTFYHHSTAWRLRYTRLLIRRLFMSIPNRLQSKLIFVPSLVDVGVARASNFNRPYLWQVRYVTEAEIELRTPIGITCYKLR